MEAQDVDVLAMFDRFCQGQCKGCAFEEEAPECEAFVLCHPNYAKRMMEDKT